MKICVLRVRDDSAVLDGEGIKTLTSRIRNLNRALKQNICYIVYFATVEHGTQECVYGLTPVGEGWKVVTYYLMRPNISRPVLRVSPSHHKVECLSTFASAPYTFPIAAYEMDLVEEWDIRDEGKWDVWLEPIRDSVVTGTIATRKCLPFVLSILKHVNPMLYAYMGAFYPEILEKAHESRKGIGT